MESSTRKGVLAFAKPRERLMSERPMKILVLGVRGIPNVQGGVETHAEQLYPRLSALGCDIEVIVRTPFVPRSQRTFGPLRLTRIWSPTTSGLEAFVHSLLGVLYATFKRPDVLHIHAIGPAIVTPIARLFGLRVVVTHHGPDYDRAKWGRLARWVLRKGEQWGMRYASARIAISNVIADSIRSHDGHDSYVIPNGAVRSERVCADESVRAFGLRPGRYFLQVSRIVPEKRQLDLIGAFRDTNLDGWKLALVGGLDETEYSQRLRAAAQTSDVVLTGFLSGTPLRQIYSHAAGFVLPSSHEGLPIALLEALSFGLPVIASDIPANLEVGLEPGQYFPLGDKSALADRLRILATADSDNSARIARQAWVTEKYDWDRIAAATLGVYHKVMKPD
jgi:glycosyltransferase involved in cell wall biosynthesis